MKKLFLTLIALVAVTVSMFAGSKITTVSGDLSALKDKKVFVEYDYSKMMILDEDTKKTMTETEFCQMKGADWVRDQGKDAVEAENWFTKTLQEKAKSFTVVADKSASDIILTVQPTTFSYGNPYAMMSGFMSNDVYGFFIGQFYITTTSGQKVAQLNCAKVTGSSNNYTWTIQKNKVYVKVAEQLVKVLNKAK